MTRFRNETVEALVETIRPRPHLFVFGAGADVIPLIQLARAIGWTTTVWDPSARFESRLRLAMAEHRRTGHAWPLAAEIDRAVAPAVVVMTHDVDRDREALATALASRARYIGVLGPRRRTDRLLAGIGAAISPTLHAPAGLALGAESPAEIALSIVAEIQAVLTGESAVSLRERTGPIHRAAGPACAVLAAGAGRRWGGPKQLADVDGQPMVRRIAAAACASRCGTVGVVLGAHAEAVWPVLAGLPVQRIDNPSWTEGMASSIRAAVDWAQASGAGALLLTVGDQPALSSAHLDAVVASAQ